MTLEIMVFVLAILFGILWYWREARNNRVYRWINKLTHSKELQMKPENGKGFVSQQPFLMRLVWITLFFALLAGILTVGTPINAFYVQYFVTAIVGTLMGTYIASVFVFAKKTTQKANLDKVFEKGREYVDDLSKGMKDEVQEEPQKASPKSEGKQTKSARDRLKDKGMIK